MGSYIVLAKLRKIFLNVRNVLASDIVLIYIAKLHKNQHWVNIVSGVNSYMFQGLLQPAALALINSLSS